MSESLNGGGNTNTKGSESLKFDFSSRGPGDCVSDEVMREISDRLIADLSDEGGGDIVRSASEPTDKTKLWLPLDAQGRPIGSVRRYDFEKQAWVDSSGDADNPAVKTSNFVEHFFTEVITSDLDRNFDLDDFEVENLRYSLTVTPLFDVDEQRQDSDGNDIEKGSFYYWMEKSSRSALVHFRNIPEGGGRFDISFQQEITT